MERKDIDWGNLGFGYVQTDMRYVSNFRNCIKTSISNNSYKN